VQVSRDLRDLYCKNKTSMSRGLAKLKSKNTKGRPTDVRNLEIKGKKDHASHRPPELRNKVYILGTVTDVSLINDVRATAQQPSCRIMHKHSVIGYGKKPDSIQNIQNSRRSCASETHVVLRIKSLVIAHCLSKVNMMEFTVSLHVPVCTGHRRGCGVNTGVITENIL